jgi:hypothetical protein
MNPSFDIVSLSFQDHFLYFAIDLALSPGMIELQSLEQIRPSRLLVITFFAAAKTDPENSPFVLLICNLPYLGLVGLQPPFPNFNSPEEFPHIPCHERVILLVLRRELRLVFSNPVKVC